MQRVARIARPPRNPGEEADQGPEAEAGQWPPKRSGARPYNRLWCWSIGQAPWTPDNSLMRCARRAVSSSR